MALLCLMAAQAVYAASPVETVETLERQWTVALRGGDTAVAGRILSDDVVYTHSNGESDNRGSYLELVRSGKLRYFVYDIEDIKVRIFGNTAISHTTAHVKLNNKGAESDGRLRIIHVYVKEGKDWHLVAHQSSRMVPAP